MTTNLSVIPALAFATVLLASTAASQTFVRVTDPTNPVVTDALNSGGGSWIDLVGDGRLDLFVANGNLDNQLNALYRNTRTGNFVRVIMGPVVNDGGSSIGGTVGDFNNDGLVDLFVTNRNNFGNFLYEGAGDTAFTKIMTGSPVTDIANSNSTSWVDLDNDGNLDLYVVNFNQNDYLYLSGGGPSFAFTRIDTTALTTGAEFSIPGAWADYNDDGLEDLFVGNAGAQNDYLYTNHGNLFFTRTTFADARQTLGASWGDYDNDGYLDLFTSGYLGAKSILYHNGGPPTFALTPVVGSLVSAIGGNWVGSAWGDYDNDGNLDLFVAQDGSPSALFHNNGPPTYGFSAVGSGPVVTNVANSFGCAWGDYDRDGNLDLFVANQQNQANFLYHNDGGTSNHWMTVRCVGTTSNRSAIGAKVRVRATIGGGPRSQLREVTGQTGYNSQNLDQHFGLGDATVADSVRVEWPSGMIETWADVPADTFLVLTEGHAPTAVEEPPTLDGRRLSLAPAAPSPCTSVATLRFSLPHRTHARLEVFDTQGRRVATLVDEWLAAGAHSARFDVPAGASAGIYFGALTVDGERRTARIIVAR